MPCLLKNLPLLLLLAGSFPVYSQCTSTGPSNGTAVANVAFTGSNFEFNNAAAALSSNNSYASASGLVALFTGETDYLQVTNFGFNIPSTAIVCGIVAEVEKSATGIGSVLGIGLSYVRDYSVRLLVDGAVAGDNKATSSNWTGADSYHTYGGPTDIWGIAWTPDQINSNNFGIAFSARISGLAMLIPNVRIDHVRITVYYTETILPNQFLAFNATASRNNSALIEWETPIDMNNTHYTVQRSHNTQQWETAPGTINKYFNEGKITYTLEDKQPFPGKSYYRIISATNSGQTSISTLQTININNNSKLKIYPNPFTDQLIISGSERTQPIRLTDLTGRTILITNTQNGSLRLPHLQPGLYLLHTPTHIFKLQKL